MRAGALSDRTVGAYLKEHYVSTWKRVGTFTAIQRDGKTVARQGGNVATYFCTPDLEVIHAIAGPVGKDRFLAEARWAVETWKAAREKAGGDRARLIEEIRALHEAMVGAAAPRLPAMIPSSGGNSFPREKTAETAPPKSPGSRGDESAAPARPGEPPSNTPDSRRLSAARAEALDVLRAPAAGSRPGAAGTDRGMHRFLAERGLPRLDDIYRRVFEGVLGQRVTDQPVRTKEVLAGPGAGFGYAARPGEDLVAKIRELQKQVEALQKEVEQLKAAKKRPVY